MHYLQTQNTNDVICITIDKYYHHHLIRTITETAIHQKRKLTQIPYFNKLEKFPT